ncbi:MAG: lipid A biosynthesis lauroyl acyltransferase [Lysobacterales bacterium]
MPSNLWTNPRHWPAVAAIGVMRASVWLPQPLRLWLGARLGEVAWLAMTQRRHITQTNIDACFPELSRRDRARRVRQHFREAGRGLLEMPLGLWGSPTTLAKLVDFEGVEHLAKARAQGGCVLLIAHVTMVELIGPMLSLISHPAPASITRDHKNPLVDHVVRRARGRYVDCTLEKKDTRGMMRWLRGGGALFYAPDQDFSFGAEFVDFFSVPAATTTATSRLVKRLGCSLVPTWLDRKADGRYQMRFFPCPSDWPGDSPTDDAAVINRWIETQVRRNPAQYLWMHRRFKTRPEGEPAFYPPRQRRAKHR